MAVFESSLLKLLIVFTIIVLLIRKQLSLGNTFMIGSISLSILFGLSPLNMLKSMGRSISDLKTISLAIIVSLILILSHSMERCGQMKRMLDNFRGMISNPKLNLIVFPAMIGLLPMPGGAIFSAPMVKQLGSDSSYSPDQLSFINYWFRHIWEYWWPLYPGVLLTVVLANLHLSRFIVLMLPLTILALGMGYLLLKTNLSLMHSNNTQKRRIRPFILEMMPIIIAIIPGLTIGFSLSQIFPSLKLSKEIGLILSLIASIGWVWRHNHMSNADIRHMLTNPKLLSMIYMILAILIFKGVLEDSHAVNQITQDLIRLQVPLPLIVVAIPFMVGMVTGITIAFVGSAFPIIIPLIHTVSPGSNLLPYMMLALVSGFTGVMLSPLHLCLILSNEYFETRMGNVYRHLWVPCGLLILTGMIYFQILQATIF